MRWSCTEYGGYNTLSVLHCMFFTLDTLMQSVYYGLEQRLMCIRYTVGTTRMQTTEQVRKQIKLICHRRMAYSEAISRFSGVESIGRHRKSIV